MTNRTNLTEPEASVRNRRALASSWLALGAVAGPLVLTLAWIVLGLTRPPTMSAWGVSGGILGMITQPVSGLGIGLNAALFNAAFVLSGVLLFAGIVGVFQHIEASGRPLARQTSAGLLALTALGLILCGVFTLESFLLHMIGFLLGCLTPVASFLVSGRFFLQIPRWQRFGWWLRLGSPLTLVLLILFFLTFDQQTMAAARGVAGITERVLVIEVLSWFVAMGWLAFKHQEELTEA